MKILIDMQSCQSESKYRGVGRYTLELTKALIRNDKKNQYSLVLNSALGFVDDLKAEFEDILPMNRVLCWTQFSGISSYGKNDKNIFISELLREAFIHELDAELLFIPNLQEGWLDSSVTSIDKLSSISNPINIICTLHDVIPLIYESEYLANDNPIRAWYFEKLSYLKKANVVMTVSHASKACIFDYLQFDNVRVVPNGIDATVFSPKEESECNRLIERFGINSQFLLYTGGINPHKNLDNLFVAYSRLPYEIKAQHVLVIVGKLPEHVGGIFNKLHKLGIKDKVIFTDYVTDDELVALYTKTRLFVFPSYQEGFGIPPLEAMATGAVVIAADIPVMREVIGEEFEAYFDPHNIDILVDKIIQGLTDESFRIASKLNAEKQVKKYTWDNSALRLIDVINEWESNNSTITPVIKDGSTLEKVIATIANSPYDFENNEYVEIAQLLSKNIKPAKRNSRVFIDISSMVHNDFKTGIQRVVRALSNELINKYDNVYLIYSYAYHSTFFFAKIRDGSYYCTDKDDVVDFYHGDKIIYLDLHPALAISHRKINADLKNRGVGVYYVIYDLIPILKPEAFVAELSQEFIGWCETTSLADGVICISRSVADEYIEWVKKNPASRKTKLSVSYFHLGADINNSLPTLGKPVGADHLLESLKNDINFIMVGTLEPRKGHLQMIKCFDELWKEKSNVNLLIVGKRGWLSDALTETIERHSLFNKQLFWFDGVSDEYLDDLYKISTCLIAASEAEGFGLPLIEAASKNMPIIARNIPVFKEVAGEYAYYFSEEDPAKQSEEIIEWIELWEHGTHPNSVGMKCLTWKESAEQFWDCLNGNIWYDKIKFNEGEVG